MECSAVCSVLRTDPLWMKDTKSGTIITDYICLKVSSTRLMRKGTHLKTVLMVADNIVVMCALYDVIRVFG
jgi:hypothetical protein